MEQVIDFLDLMGRLILAASFALTPGMLVWLSVIAAALLLRRFRHRIAA